ncbi:LacI family DNA-binding transcriptional regulator [Emcibacter nanhaiensis]|uniref:LacI family transcriptional regulator n=1 Tax=Emcibacter nanhaiensis TaxID=1505037 RepID=A0A501PF33_9PROT|nr:LacI family DNA-binding transcriptional regulator [Emcibacter nanhaiensis]TPD59030.1 LacI family transcriptional regulator [Emcibacter nanhaiensis]
MASKRVTIKDLAKAVGVNPSTVSRALNPATKHLITEEVIEKISKAADEMGYFPNRMAAALVHNKSHTIGLIISTITNPVFPPMVCGLEAALYKAGYTLVTMSSDNIEDYERTAYRRLRERAIDGCILASATREDPVVDEFLKHGFPLVLVNRMTDRQDVNAVINNDEAGMQLAVDHLTSLGHTKIGHISGPLAVSTCYTRLQGFKAGMRAKGLDPDHVVEAKEFSAKEGYRAMKKLLAGNAGLTAVAAGSDILALGCLDAIREAGLSCPEDISLTGFNDIPMMDRISPALTTVTVPQYEIGQKAAEILLAMLEGSQPVDGEAGQVIKVLPKLTLRESTRRLA